MNRLLDISKTFKYKFGSDIEAATFANLLHRQILSEDSCYKVIGFKVNNSEISNIFTNSNKIKDDIKDIYVKLTQLNFKSLQENVKIGTRSVIYLSSGDSTQIVDQSVKCVDSVKLFNNPIIDTFELVLYIEYNKGFFSEEENAKKLANEGSNIIAINSYHKRAEVGYSYNDGELSLTVKSLNGDSEGEIVEKTIQSIITILNSIKHDFFNSN